jgi:hypothetical protein
MSVPEKFPPEDSSTPSGRAELIDLGRRRRASAGTSRRRGVAIGLVGLLLLLAVGGGVGGYLAKQRADQLQAQLAADLAGGAAELQLGGESVKQANTANDPGPLKVAREHFKSARQHFQAAQRRAENDPLLKTAGEVPVLGSTQVAPRVRTVQGLAQLGIALADAGSDGVEINAELIQPSDASLKGGQRLIAVLKQSAPGVEKLKHDLERAKNAESKIDVLLLPKAQRDTYAKAKGQIQSGLDGLVEFQRLTPVLLEVLGDGGPRTYLVEQVDPAELRGSGGFIGSYTLVTADRGLITVAPGKDVFTIDEGPNYPARGSQSWVDPPRALGKAFTHGWVFGDSNFWPDFPASARAGQDLLLRETGTKVDGVITIDPWAVAHMLEVTGPLAITEAAFPVTVDSKNFPEEVFQRLEKDTNNVPDKKAFFPAVATTVIDHLAKLPSQDWTKLLEALNAAVSERHMMVYFNNPNAQAEMVRMGWSGAVSPPSDGRELMLEVEANYGATKSNHFLERSYDLTLNAEGGKLRHKLVIHLKNRIEDGYLGGRHYSYYLRFYCPAPATEVKVTGLARYTDPSPFATDEKPNGLKLIDGWNYLPITDLKLGYATQDVIIEYNTDFKNLAGGHEIYWQKQPGTLSDPVKVTYQVGGRTHTAGTDLKQDRVLVLRDNGITVQAGSAGAARLPVIG